MEIDVAEHKYVIGKMKSRQQRNVLRRLFPLLLASKELLMIAGQALGKMKDIEEAAPSNPAEITELFSAAGPLASAFSGMKDEDCDYIFDTCLGVVKRRVAGGLTDITLLSGDLRFEDITLPHQMQLVFAVMKENFEDFFVGLPGLSPAKGVAGAPSS